MYRKHQQVHLQQRKYIRNAKPQQLSSSESNMELITAPRIGTARNISLSPLARSLEVGEGVLFVVLHIFIHTISIVTVGAALIARRLTKILSAVNSTELGRRALGWCKLVSGTRAVAEVGYRCVVGWVIVLWVCIPSAELARRCAEGICDGCRVLHLTVVSEGDQ